MLGTFRLLLAAMVVTSHTGGNFGNTFLPGVAAVVVFFMISGYAITGLLQKRFPDTKSASSFYFERFIRLAPQYYFWLAIAFFFSLYLKLSQWSSINTNGFIPYGLFSYLTVVPLGLQAYLDPAFRVYTHSMAQAATLGIEITLYVCSPWILKNRKLSWGVALICLGIFASTALKLLPENIYTYYTSPGPMIFYLLGSFLYRKDWASLTIFTTAVIIILLLGMPQGFNKEFLVAVIIGLPILILLVRYPANKLDSALGDASYGVYLGHGVVIAIMTFYLGSEHPPAFRIAAIITSCFLGWISFYIVERPTVSYRRRLNTKIS